MDSWIPRVRAIKERNPNAIVLATFHATEIWAEDLVAANRWLPDRCLMRNADGSACSWWVGLVFTNNLFIEECWQAAVDNAIHALAGGLLDAGVDGVFLDGVVPYNLGCHAADVNCTHAGCSKTPQPSSAALEEQWEQMYIKWFAALKAHWPKLLWVNNVVDTLQPALINVSNGRMFEGGDGLGLDSVYNGHITIADRIVESRKWSTQA
eukprot:COSAG01_NODE_14901_length_1397_cov_1.605547_1_plen_208_part_10